MKLFLSSLAISPKLEPYFCHLVGKACQDITFAFIENAADLYPEEKRMQMHERGKEFEQQGLKVHYLDLRMYTHQREALYDLLKSFDVIWVGGGNVFYLRWIMQESGLDTILPRLLQEGIVYGGGSAGAIVVGPILDAYDVVDDPTMAPELIKNGIGMHNGIIIPHWGDTEYASQLEAIREYHKKQSFPIYCLDDTQALIVVEGKVEIV